MASQHTRRKASVTLVVDPAGDVILEPGGPDPESMKVSSWILGSCSKQLQRIVDEAEQATPKETPKRIWLLDDDAKALYVLCCILHGKATCFPWTDLPSTTLLEIVSLALKYGVLFAVSRQAE